jgi:hypothetical protein
MAVLKQATTYFRVFPMVQLADHVSPLLGATVTVNLSKNTAGFAAMAGNSGTAIEIGNGFYYAPLTPVDSNTIGDLAYNCTATGGDPTQFVDQVQLHLLSDVNIDASGNVSITSSYKKNQAALLPFTMTVGNPPLATAGLAPAGQKNFGSGFTPIAGAITDLGNGAYLASLLAADTNAPVAYYHFTSTTPNANEQDITVYFQP